MYIDVDITEEQYLEFNLYCVLNKINPEEFLKNYILNTLKNSSIHLQKENQYTKNSSWPEKF